MDRKKELKQQYKEREQQAGVYQIKNTKNQKVLVDSAVNLKTMNGKLLQLRVGSHMNRALQEEWKQFGEDSFVFEVLEILKKKEEGYFDIKDELKKLEERWLDHLQPYGERGYNRQRRL
ncbi:GIY-YIG nuclease family protein [Ammoniphilus sp. CFH 90114]|uniref:GIY-YIG nuclease family protein n=1 Tax=Ammoniphilus sp. CFH 90114 TaxID=2493665 RepID=UPI001F0CC7AE|nr:GIY-YIG nuclease family protein [Ammoniphilus sp. CFH 90114]